MHYLFWLSADIRNTRTAALTLGNLNDSAGFSGTETCLMELASHVARRGHRSTILGGYRGDEDGSDVALQITYTTDANIVDVPGFAADIDVVIPMFALEDPRFQDLLERIHDARLAAGRDAPTLVVWCHCFLAGQALDHVLRWRDSGRRVGLVGVSDWVGKYMAPWAATASLPYMTIENAMSPAVFGEDFSNSVVREPHSFVFHATHERGGDVACRVHHRIGAGGGFNLASYDTNDKGHHRAPNDTLVNFHGSMSKRGLAKLLWGSDYFVYPLVLPDTRVHHDTYGCVVLEALVCGVLVVTWDVACMRSVYGESPVVLVPPPPCQGYDPQAPFGCNLNMLSEESVDALAAAVRSLQALPAEHREGMRVAGRAWALRQTWEARAHRLVAWVDRALL